MPNETTLTLIWIALPFLVGFLIYLLNAQLFCLENIEEQLKALLE